MRGRELKQTMQANRRVYGVAMEGFGQPRWPGFFANYAPVDFVFMDTEHMPHDREKAAWAMQCYAAYGIAPLLRIPEISPGQAAMAMDAGAHGIIVPYVETVEQARSMLGAVKYRPLKGQTLEQALLTGNFPSPETKAYLEGYNPDATLVLMIESAPGIANLPDILALGGVDAIFIGPHDLSIALGVPEQYEHPRFVAAVDEVIAQCQAAHVGVGMHIFFTEAEQALDWCRRGLNFISYRGDTLFVAEGLRTQLGLLRRVLDAEPL